ncbi:hypothetical protein [Alkalimarinus sediminis]|uniref:Uncharacterized protein n=1 Tax=Alkalimarinus sediminis TaxID=1632866 RepID=A0A9E8KR32_9ALTE|nr:hypothetical protein [Alkalimarinus sediminis]UZW75860.1 hypothetical protein NNL22_04560 [Alkalimarinus sediminis]
MEHGEPQLVRKSNRRSSSAFICTKCRQGRMQPLIQEGEPEYTDLFECDQCNHQATIPSLVIISSQLISAIMGGILSVYLFIQHLSKVLTSFQFNTTDKISVNITLMVIAALFLLGFGYTLYRGFIGISRRKKYKRGQ